MKYKLIATDMDGTLLDDNHKLTNGNIEAIVNIQKKGVKFVLASGRPSFAMFEQAKQLKMDENGGYVLAFNGGQLIDMSNNEIVFHEGLTKNDIEIVYQISKELEIPMVLYFEDTVYATKNTKLTKYEADQCNMKLVEFENLEKLYELGITETTKCMLIDEPEKIKEAEKYMENNYNDKYFFAISKPIFLEIANKNVNKGKTLKKLGEILNIEMEEMIAVGDSGNDIPLLEVSGMPVAVENAISEIKEISKFISTNNNNDALKTVIENFFD